MKNACENPACGAEFDLWTNSGPHRDKRNRYCSPECAGEDRRIKDAAEASSQRRVCNKPLTDYWSRALGIARITPFWEAES